MTNIENLVTDLETSKALHEARIECETAFVWVRHIDYGWRIKLYANRNTAKYDREIIPAFTAGEMMQVLPSSIPDPLDKDKRFFLNVGKDEHKPNCRAHYSKGGCIFWGYGSQETIEQALAKLMLWCRQEGYL